MPAEVLEFRPRDRHDPHNQGLARCMVCGREWVAVAPVGTIWLECPGCGSGKGFFKHPSLPSEGAETWTCDCGCQHFFIQRDGVRCANCGVDARPFD